MIRFLEIIGLLNLIEFGGGGPPAKKRRRKMKRTTHRSVKGKKLYAVRDAKGRFVDIQTYERAHRMDLKKKSKKEPK
jgi:hypothetical protein